jgi:RHH-type transcriptional regulator, rel operon repressor / antitoxin RelB
VIVVRLRLEIEKRLKKLARTIGRTTFCLREAVLQQPHDLEGNDLALLQLDDNLPGVPLEEVERRLGLRD